ncbi:unnamed protein product [Owenia fusiformis]|uniref:Uncharacterized protein n=1 Tax=Owenia fusiformis TaxID=6347 RepID=A0A8J1TYQ4_OWEFU|nr:unnamed protein product [Owenia fusiformis]
MQTFDNSTDISTEMDGPDSIQDAVPSTGALTESYINVTSPTKLSNLTLVDTFERHAHKFPNKDALVVADIDLNKRECLSFKEWHRQSDNLAASLIRLGLTNGDAVAMVIPNRIEHPVAWMAALKANLVPCFLSLSRKSGDDLKLSLNDLKARAVIILRKADHIDREFNEVTRRVFETVCTSEYDADLPHVKSVICIGKTMKGASDFHNLIKDTGREDTDALSNHKALITAESICAVYQTSGTTGRPKHVVHRHFGIVNSYRFIAKRKRINAEDRYFSDLPMSWGAGLAGLFHCMVTG